GAEDGGWHASVSTAGKVRPQGSRRLPAGDRAAARALRSAQGSEGCPQRTCRKPALPRHGSKARRSVDLCSLGLPGAPLFWLHDCDRLALGASHSDQNVYEALDSKQLAEAEALISRR